MTLKLKLRTSRKDSGFSMVELLMAAFVLAIGLLGLAALQVLTIQGGTGSRMRGTAVFIAHSFLDQIQAEGALAAGERFQFGTVDTASTTFNYVDPANASPSDLANGPSYTIHGLLTSDPYYTSTNPAPPTVFTLTWKRNQGTINGTSQTAFQEFIVNVSWNESGPGNTTTSKSISVSRYVRM